MPGGGDDSAQKVKQLCLHACRNPHSLTHRVECPRPRPPPEELSPNPPPEELHPDPLPEDLRPSPRPGELFFFTIASRQYGFVCDMLRSAVRNNITARPPAHPLGYGRRSFVTVASQSPLDFSAWMSSPRGWGPGPPMHVFGWHEKHLTKKTKVVKIPLILAALKVWPLGPEMGGGMGCDRGLGDGWGGCPGPPAPPQRPRWQILGGGGTLRRAPTISDHYQAVPCINHQAAATRHKQRRGGGLRRHGCLRA